jgi:lipopolysaccharide exporter
LARLKASAFVTNILVVITGTAAAQLAGFAMSPVISRLFSPEEFGVFGSFVAVTGVIGAGVTLEYTQAIMLPKEQGDAINLFLVSCLATAVIAVLSLAACLMAPGVLVQLTHVPAGWRLTMLALAVFVTGLNQASQAWAVRVKAFRHTSASQVIRSLSASGTQVTLGYSSGGAYVLILASVLGNVLASLNLGRVVLRDLGTLRHEIRWNRMGRLALEYRDFPIYSASANVLNALSQGLPVLLLTHYYGIAVAGAYAFGVRILQTPANLVLVALRQVLFQRACEADHRGARLLPLYMKTTLGLFALTLLPSVIIIGWAPQIFVWLFGPQWQTAGNFARPLMVWVMFMFCNVPSVLFGRILRMQRLLFLFDVLLLAGRTIALVVGGMYLSSLSTVILFSWLGASMNVVFILLVGGALWKREIWRHPEPLADFVAEA